MDSISAASASARTFSFSCEASASRRLAFSRSTRSSSVSTLATVWMATCHSLRSTHNGTEANQTTTIPTQTKNIAGPLARR